MMLTLSDDDFNLFIRRCDGRGLQARVLLRWEKPAADQAGVAPLLPLLLLGVLLDLALLDFDELAPTHSPQLQGHDSL